MYATDHDELVSRFPYGPLYTLNLPCSATPPVWNRLHLDEAGWFRTCLRPLMIICRRSPTSKNYYLLLLQPHLVILSGISKFWWMKISCGLQSGILWPHFQWVFFCFFHFQEFLTFRSVIYLEPYKISVLLKLYHNFKLDWLTPYQLSNITGCEQPHLH